jgi:hypothetical protein
MVDCCGMTIVPSLTSFSHTLTFFPKWFVKCGRSSSFGLSAVTPVMNYFGNTGSKRLGNRSRSRRSRAVSRLNAHWKY